MDSPNSHALTQSERASALEKTLAHYAALQQMRGGQRPDALSGRSPGNRQDYRRVSE